MQKTLQKSHKYPEFYEHSLRKALAKHYHNTLEPENFITENGGVGVIELIIKGFLKQGEACIVTSPTFMAYSRIAKMYGAEVLDVPLLDNATILDVKAILKSITPKTRLIWICNPNNPTGAYIPKSIINELLDKLPEGVIVVYDEVYKHFASKVNYTTGLQYVVENKPVITVNSFSKAYGLAGIRIGYGYTSKKMATYLNKLCRPYLLSSLAIDAAKAALTDTSFNLKIKEHIVHSRNYLQAYLEESAFSYWKSQTNFLTIKCEALKVDLAQEFIKDGILVKSLTNFGIAGGVRITIGKEPTNEAIIHCLERIEKSYNL